MLTPSTTIAERISVGATPAAPNGNAAQPASTYTVKADLRREYVSAGGHQWLSAYAHSLTAAIDDLTVDFGDDLYQRMLYESQVSAATTIYKASILESGVSLKPAVEDEAEDGYELAQEIHAFCEHSLEEMSTSIDDVLWDMLDAVALGSRVAELIYDWDRTISGKTRLALSAIKVRPRHSTSFVVDAYNNVLGLLVQMPGQVSPYIAGSVLTDLDKLPNFMIREKFAVWTHRPINNDPRGTSSLRPAYDPWWRKQQIKVEYLKYLTQFAGPSLFGTTPPNALPQPALDSLGNVLLDSNGQALIAATPEEAMAAELQKSRNMSIAVFPDGAKVQVIASSGDGKAFLDAMRGCDIEITRAILTQELTINEGLSGSSRAGLQVHQDVRDTLVRQGKRTGSRMIRRDILAGMVRYNWGDAALALVPQVTLGDIAEKDFRDQAAGWASLAAAGLIDPSQWAGMDAELNLPQRDPASITAAIERLKAPPPAPIIHGGFGPGLPPTSAAGDTSAPVSDAPSPLVQPKAGAQKSGPKQAVAA